MQTFDFITNDTFRAGLEADYDELERCSQASAWKAVLVLAGSVVEAILVDALLAVEYQKRKGKDPLTMQLADLVMACKDEAILSQRSADLCSVVRSYRNLIHPGRVVRLQDTADENSAKIALSLIPVVAREVAAQREKTYGLTAIQLLAKVERDPTAMAILKHLLAELNEIERERLLLKVIPERRAGIEATFDEFPEVQEIALMQRLSGCYRAALEGASKELKAKVAGRYIAILKVGSEAEVMVYDGDFFRCTDLEHLSAPQVALVKEHVLARMKAGPRAAMELAEGLERYLEPGDAIRWINPLIRQLASDSASDGEKNELTQFAERAIFNTSKPVREQMVRLVQEWEDHLARRGSAGAVVRLKTLEAVLTMDEMPF